MSKTHAALEEFGKMVTIDVHDRSCWQLQQWMARPDHPYNSLDERSAEIVRDFLAVAVEATFANFLRCIETYSIPVLFTNTDGTQIDVEQTSDGLQGEIATEDGWLARYSKYNKETIDAVEPGPPPVYPGGKEIYAMQRREQRAPE